MFLYKKWTFAILLNNLVLNYFSIFSKTIIYLKFDIYKYAFFNYITSIQFSNYKILSIKKRLNFL